LVRDFHLLNAVGNGPLKFTITKIYGVPGFVGGVEKAGWFTGCPHIVYRPAMKVSQHITFLIYRPILGGHTATTICATGSLSTLTSIVPSSN
jgi:hypothetical protein